MVDALCRLNETGFLTVSSQPGVCIPLELEQREYVEGFICSERLLKALNKLSENYVILTVNVATRRLDQIGQIDPDMLTPTTDDLISLTRYTVPPEKLDRNAKRYIHEWVSGNDADSYYWVYGTNWPLYMTRRGALGVADRREYPTIRQVLQSSCHWVFVVAKKKSQNRMLSDLLSVFLEELT